MLLEEKRHAQTAADAAALSAANDLFKHYPANQGIDASGTAVRNRVSASRMFDASW